jgi:hypothetical protein
MNLDKMAMDEITVYMMIPNRMLADEMPAYMVSR